MHACTAGIKQTSHGVHLCVCVHFFLQSSEQKIYSLPGIVVINGHFDNIVSVLTHTLVPHCTSPYFAVSALLNYSLF